MNYILVTIKNHEVFEERQVNPIDIAYINPSLHGCTLHFLNDDESIYIYQDENKLRKLVREWYKKEFNER